MIRNLRDKVVLITGASSGIGKETAKLFAMEGCKLALTYKTKKKDMEKVVKECISLGAKNVEISKLDLTNNLSIKRCIRKFIKKYKKIDILINNAGVITWNYLSKQTFKDIELQVRTNLEGLIKITKECLPYLREMIINIASRAGIYAHADLTTYCATKYGVRGFTMALADEIPQLLIYSVNPKATATSMTGFKGMSPQKVGIIILNTAKGLYNKPSGSDINVWELI